MTKWKFRVEASKQNWNVISLRKGLSFFKSVSFRSPGKRTFFQLGSGERSNSVDRIGKAHTANISDQAISCMATKDSLNIWMDSFFAKVHHHPYPCLFSFCAKLDEVVWKNKTLFFCRFATRQPCSWNFRRAHFDISTKQKKITIAKWEEKLGMCSKNLLWNRNECISSYFMALYRFIIAFGTVAV